MLPDAPLHSFGCCRVPLFFVPLISRWLSAQCAKAAAVLIGLLFCLFRSVAGMKWDLWTVSGGWSWGGQPVDQTMMRLPSSPHGDPVEMQFRLTFHLVNNVSLTIWSCLPPQKSTWQLHLSRLVCPNQGWGCGCAFTLSIKRFPWSAWVWPSALIKTCHWFWMAICQSNLDPLKVTAATP